GHIIVAVGNDSQFKKLCALIDRPDLDDGRFDTVTKRTLGREGLVAEIQKTMLTRDSQYWLDGLVAAGIPHGPINNYKEVFDHPQVAARGLKVDMQGHPTGKTISVVASPI